MKSVLTFCTYFDANYLPRALAMLDSLVAHCGQEFHVYALCLDDESHSRLSASGRSDVTSLALPELEAHDPELLGVKGTRSRLEYHYTCGPTLPLYVFQRAPHVDVVTYIDADLYFYSDPRTLIDEFHGASVSLTAHRFPEFRRAEDTGVFNVGWLSFRRDADGLACLRWWRRSCLDWCYERFEGGKYAESDVPERVASALRWRPRAAAPRGERRALERGRLPPE